MTRNARSVTRLFMLRGVSAGWFVFLIVLIVCASSAFADSPPGVKFSSVGNTAEELTNDISGVTSSSVHFRGEVNPEGGPSETLWQFEYTTAEGLQKNKWKPVPGGAGGLPGSDAEWHTVEANLTGLLRSTVYYARLEAHNNGGAITSPNNGNEYQGKFVTVGPPSASVFAVHAIHGEKMRAFGELNPSGATTYFHFEYVTQEQFEKSGFGESVSAPVVEVFAEPEIGEFTGEIGAQPRIVSEDLPGMQFGGTYHYRLVAANSAGAAVSGEGVLTVPVPAAEGAPVACPNEVLRYGASARLPDCRAYEQVTPVEKRGAQDIFRYGVIGEATQVGEDGEHFALHASGVQWSGGSDAAVSNYFFSRTAGGWGMVSATQQPQAGIYSYLPQVFSADLTQIGLEVGWSTTSVESSKEVAFEVGPPGGPYTVAASVPRSAVVKLGEGLVGESADGSKIVLEVEDHTLLGSSTGTTSGADLYEYSEGELRRVNVQTDGKNISTCGATMAHIKTGSAEGKAAISNDGSRVFFMDNCTHELYMRIGGRETVDIGMYALLYPDRNGQDLLLEKENGAAYELVLYDTLSASAKVLLLAHERLAGTNVVISQDLTTLYVVSKERLTAEAPLPSTEITSPANVYRYEVLNGKLNYLMEVSANENNTYGLSVSSNGRYIYLTVTGVAGFTGTGGQVIKGVYLYDSGENAIECITCASPFNSEPRPQSILNLPPVYASANGDYVFFDTVATLVPQDIDGEVAPEQVKSELNENEFNLHPSPSYSVSSDVYEWRRNGLDGCTHIQGCLALISSGRGGLKNILLGATPSGRDVFFGTHEALVAQDGDTSGDVYDARIGGGYPAPPPRPVECEGDACNTPLAAPIDTTPASLSFARPLSTHSQSAKKPIPKVKHKKAKAKRNAKTQKGRARFGRHGGPKGRNGR
jgi:hypothetical protein